MNTPDLNDENSVAEWLTAIGYSPETLSGMDRSARLSALALNSVERTYTNILRAQTTAELASRLLGIGYSAADAKHMQRKVMLSAIALHEVQTFREKLIEDTGLSPRVIEHLFATVGKGARRLHVRPIRPRDAADERARIQIVGESNTFTVE
jgi:hypothetical protein